MMKPEGYFDVCEGNESCVSVDAHKFRERGDLVKIWVPNRVVSIGNFAFYQCSALEEVLFEPGGISPLSLGVMAFACCTAMKSVGLPGRIRSIARGAFRDSVSLCAVSVGAGHGLIDVSTNVFDNCAAKDAMKQQLDAVNAERLRTLPYVAMMGSRGTSRNPIIARMRASANRLLSDREGLSSFLQSLYGFFRNNQTLFPFDAYVEKMSWACDRFAAVDWSVATVGDLQDVFYDQVKDVAGGFNYGEITTAEFAAVDHAECRQICQSLTSLVTAKNASDLVFQQKVLFDQVLPHHPSAYNRLVMALNPGIVVPVPNEAKLIPEYEWLTGDTVPEGVDVDWFRISRIVRSELTEYLPGKDIYQVGVFAWFFAVTFREDLEVGKPGHVQRQAILQFMRDCGV